MGEFLLGCLVGWFANGISFGGSGLGAGGIAAARAQKNAAERQAELARMSARDQLEREQRRKAPE